MLRRAGMNGWPASADWVLPLALYWGGHSGVRDFPVPAPPWYHSTADFRGNFYVDITDFWDQKERAIKAHVSENMRTNEKWLSFFRNEAENAGQKIGVKLAEIYEVVKWLEAGE